ncbi:putative membrane protein [Gammaproteobacteria bacterium MOLA455]|nr:putative membrane protein [Gammaproteobacteria bacterium MOLA455]
MTRSTGSALLGHLMNLFMGLDIQLMFEAIPLLVAIALSAWLVSLVIEDISIVDCLWSIMLLGSVGTYAYRIGFEKSLSTVNVVLLLMVAVWALRLSAFLILRGRNRGEERRYQAMRKKLSSSFAIKSLVNIFLLRALLIWLLSSLFVVALSSVPSLSWSHWHTVGAALWLFGFSMEALADLQLYRFNQLVVRDSETLSSGLWRYSRHPNYFGECCVWCGWVVFAIPSASAATLPWLLLAPMIMMALLLKLSGISHMERGITQRRPDYRRYIETTSAFIPWKPAQKIGLDL